MTIIEDGQIKLLLDELEKDGYNIFNAKDSALSFKKYFLPTVQEMFTKNESEIKTAKPPRKFILFDLNQNDLSALTYLDEIMSHPREDFFYFQNRKQAVVIGLINEKFGTPSGGDLIFQKINKHSCMVSANTKTGEKIVKKYNDFFKQESALTLLGHRMSKDNTKELLDSVWQTEIQNLLKDPEALKDAVEWSRDSKIWDELAEICLGCGVCSYVCPLCYCFSLEDKIELNGSCSRCRKWTSCVLPEFSKTSGGHSPRPTLRERYYNWFYHKFVRGYLEYGKSECSGCERCKIYCPAKIDILEVLKKILEKYKK